MFFRFLMVGGSGFVIDAGLTHLLVQLGVAPWLARVPAIILAVTYTWLANRYFTYRTEKSLSAVEGIHYGLVAVTMAQVNYIIYLGLIIYGLAPVAAIAVAAVFQTLISFYAYRRFVFRIP